MKCGGMKKSGGTTSAVKKIKMKAGGFAAGIPYKIGAGSTDGGSSPTGMMKKGGSVTKKTSTVKKMKLGGDPGDPKPSSSVLKNIGMAGLAGGLIGLLTTEKGIDRRAKKAEARYMERQTKKALKNKK